MRGQRVMPDALATRQGLVAEFATETAIIAAARELRERQYQLLDAFVPRSSAELESLIAPVRSTLPRSVFVGGLLGALTGLGVEWFCNAWDSPLNVGGRPPFSLPAFIPITFELGVLFAALTAFVGILLRAGLPRLADPVFTTPDFERASIDHFFLYIAAADPRFRASELEQLLAEHECLRVHWTGHAPFPEAREAEAAASSEQVTT
jgi:hypothetical protein